MLTDWDYPFLRSLAHNLREPIGQVEITPGHADIENRFGVLFHDNKPINYTFNKAVEEVILSTHQEPL